MNEIVLAEVDCIDGSEVPEEGEKDFEVIRLVVCDVVDQGADPVVDGAEETIEDAVGEDL